MALQAQLLLPDNLRSSYLRGDFIERGKSVAIGRVHPDSSDDRNRRSLVFSFSLIDTITRDDVPLERVTSILISNDPEFTSAATVELVDWPSSPVTFSEDKNYRRKLDPAFFFGESEEQYLTGFDGDGEEDGDGTFSGYYIIENWPLSGNGGLSTVYFQAVVKGVGYDAEISYPNGYKLYDQIVWQSERPSAPGVGGALMTNSGCTGRKTTWEFSAAEEGSTGVYGLGVARYLADFIEVRPSDDGPSLVSNASTALRSIARTMDPSASTAYEYDFDGLTIDGSGEAITTSTQVTVPEDTGGHDARLCYLDDGVDVGGTRPDFAVQAHIAPQLESEPDATFTFYIGCSNGSRGDANDSSQFVVAIYSAPYEIPYAYLYRVESGVQSPTTEQVIILPEYTRELLRAGGLFELYVSSRPGDARSIVQAYFTGDDSGRSPWLANSLVDCIFDANDTNAVWGFAGFKSSVATTATFGELCLATGRFALGADADGCKDQNIEIHFPSAHLGTGGRPFSQALGADWTAIVEADGDLYDEYNVVDTGSGELLQLYAPATTDDRAATEWQCEVPTFSERAFVDFEVAHHSGDFYVTFSRAPYDGARCAMSRLKSEAREPATPPTIAILFSTVLQGVFVVQRLIGGGYSSRKLMPYEPNAATGFDVQVAQSWSIQISSNDPENRADGTWVVLRRNGEFYGRQRLDSRLPGERMGLGYYVAFGVRGGMFTDINDWTEESDIVSGLATIYDFSILPEPPVRGLDGQTAPSRRRITKKTPGHLEAKPFMGQILASGLTDLKDFEFKNPDRAGGDFAPARLVTSANVDLGAAPDEIDMVPLRAGDRILVRKQNIPAENGIYVVESVGDGTDGVWVRSADLSDSEQATYGSRCLIERTYEARYLAEADIPTTTAVDSDVLDQAPDNIAGMLILGGDRILCNAQANPARNGMYVVEDVGTGADGRWRRAPEMNSSEEIVAGVLVRVNKHATLAGRVFALVSPDDPEINVSSISFTALASGAASYAGTSWWLDQNDDAFVLGENALSWRSADFAQVLLSYHATGIHSSQLAGLLEIMVRPRDNGYIPDDFPRVRFFQYVDGDDFGLPLTPWLEPAYVTGGSLQGTPVITPHSYLCQYELWKYDLVLTDDSYYWLLVSVPAYCELATALGANCGAIEARDSDTMDGINKTWSMWHKLFLRRNVRRNNAVEGALLQMRMSAASHARWLSEASALSEEVVVDRAAPQFGSLGRPLVTEAQQPTVRTLTIDIEAEDSGSGVMAFRVIKEGDLGVVVYGPWLSWRDFVRYRDLTACRVALDLNEESVSLSGVPASVDGITNLQEGDRVLVFNNPVEAQNGPYIVSTGAWERANELDEDSEITSNIRVLVTEGDVHEGDTFYISLGDPADEPPFYVIDVDPINFTTESTQARVARYTAYLHDSWPLLPDGTLDEDMISPQNQGYDGPRRVWVQTVDFAGNISESDPLTVTAQGLAIVDTTPPSGSAEFVRPSDATALNYINSGDNAMAKVTGYDRVTAVREIRTRLTQAGISEEWGRWLPMQEFLSSSMARNVPADSELTDGLKRLEIQFRDYGNNANQPEAIWDFMDNDGSQYAFLALKPWSPPGESTEWLYMAGIKAENFSEYELIDSEDPYYPASKAYLVTQPAEAGSRVVYVRDEDDITVTVNAEEWIRFTPFVPTGDPCTGAPNNSYRIDSERGLVVFCSTLPAGATLSATVRRKSGIIRRWNGSRNEHVYDLGGVGERAVLSLASAGTYLVLGGYSGNVWYFDGDVVLDTAHTATDGEDTLPVTCLTTHRFHHEESAYLYAATSKKARLYRAPINEDGTIGGWESVALGASYFQSSSGDITCAISAADRLFFGTSSDRIIEYRRIYSFGEETETVTYHLLTSQRIGNNEPYSMPVSAIARAQDQVMFTISNKPEVWSLPIVKVKTPDSDEQWARVEFDRWFINRCAPAQFYASGGNSPGSEFDDGDTETRENGSFTEWVAITDPNNESGQREFTMIKAPADRAVFYSFADGTDWEQLASANTAYTLEFTTQYIGGDGRQSIDVADGRYTYRLDLGANDLIVTSGDETITVNYQGFTSEIEAFSASRVVYPERGLKKLWSFAESPSVEDHGPYFIGDQAGKDDVFKWKAGRFVVPTGDLKLAGEVLDEDESESASFTTKTRFLRVQALDGGFATILWSDGDILVDSRTSVFVRLRLPLGEAGRRGVDAKVRIAWSTATGVTTDNLMNFEELPAAGDDSFHTYQFRPAWDGVARTLALQVSGVELLTDDGLVALTDDGDYHFDIDYIAVASDTANNNISDAPVPVRVGISGRHFKLWVGESEAPLFESRNFLSRPSTRTELKFGKVDAPGAGSSFIWQEMRFYGGDWLPPITIGVLPAASAWRFPSAGGARCLTFYQGTIWCLLDGVNKMSLQDNPDDRAMKAFSYIAELQGWRKEPGDIPRITGGYGIIRPFAAANYRNSLVVSGQRASITYSAVQTGAEALAETEEPPSDQYDSIPLVPTWQVAEAERDFPLPRPTV